MLLLVAIRSSGPGLEFVNQLCVEDEERAATLVAVSNKYVYWLYALSSIAHSDVCVYIDTMLFPLRPLFSNMLKRSSIRDLLLRAFVFAMYSLKAL